VRLDGQTMANRDSAQQIGSPRPVYIERVNAVIDYIEANLGSELTLAHLADVAHFSPYHFHRVFGMLVGETLARFIGRLRVERAATLVVQQPRRAITAIATDCGFTNPSSFSRAFKEAFGMSATAWRNGGYLDYQREPGESIRDVIGNIGSVTAGYGIIAAELHADSGLMTWRIRAGTLGTATVTVEELPSVHVAYVRHTGRYQGLGEVFTDLFTRLMSWAQPRRLVDAESWLLALYHDNPSITEDTKLRVSACLTVPPGTATSGDVGQMDVAGGTFAVGHFELGEQDYPEAWYALAGGWLPDSGYEPDNRHPYERYFIGGEAADPTRQPVDICLPVRPLRRY
jgi:AraC family transcriptional regulator